MAYQEKTVIIWEQVLLSHINIGYRSITRQQRTLNRPLGDINCNGIDSYAT